MSITEGSILPPNEAINHRLLRGLDLQTATRFSGQLWQPLGSIGRAFYADMSKLPPAI
jgi:hypothetical protein